jgi:hypothetical protein
VFYRSIGVEYQIAFTLPAAAGRLLGVALSRSERDYRKLGVRTRADAGAAVAALLSNSPAVSADAHGWEG